MAISYRSTCGGGGVSFEEALLRGLAPDGGLYVPDVIPRVHFGRVFGAGTFPEMAHRMLEVWTRSEIDPGARARILHDALDFPVPLVALEGGAWKGTFILELFHGPTLSFKDFGARIMARWMGHFLQRRSGRLTVLVATSGDTGSAVADGFAGQPGIEVVLLYPKGKVSLVQERQLITAREGVRTLAVNGDFDDCQRMVKDAFLDPTLASAGLTSANSINVGRLLPQMLYYAWAVRELGAYGSDPASGGLSGEGLFDRAGHVGAQRCGAGDWSSESVGVVDHADYRLEQKPWFCVPSGNLGNLTGGVLAYRSGLPVAGFLAAHNLNDFFPRFLRGEHADFAPTVRTYSNAMDVGAPSNFERLSVLLRRDSMRRLIEGDRVTDEDTIASIRRVYDEAGYVADPHTAVGLEAVRRRRASGAIEGPAIVLATAHPAKFPETVREALGFEPEIPEPLASSWQRGVVVEEVPPTSAVLRQCLAE